MLPVRLLARAAPRRASCTTVAPAGPKPALATARPDRCSVVAAAKRSRKSKSGPSAEGSADEGSGWDSALEHLPGEGARAPAHSDDTPLADPNALLDEAAAAERLAVQGSSAAGPTSSSGRGEEPAKAKQVTTTMSLAEYNLLMEVRR
jgi:hypothetical protein